MKFQLVRSPRKQIDTNFGGMALSFQLISIASLLNLSSCDSNIWKVNISDVYEREVRNSCIGSYLPSGAIPTMLRSCLRDPHLCEA